MLKNVAKIASFWVETKPFVQCLQQVAVFLLQETPIWTKLFPAIKYLHPAPPLHGWFNCCRLLSPWHPDLQVVHYGWVLISWECLHLWRQLVRSHLLLVKRRRPRTLEKLLHSGHGLITPPIRGGGGRGALEWEKQSLRDQLINSFRQSMPHHCSVQRGLVYLDGG